jgi:ribosomal protein S18 acetylase RimI-like enzyme
MNELSICVYSNVNKKTDLFENVVYNNFIHLAQDPDLKHTVQEIHRIFTCDGLQLYLCILNKKIVAYLLGEIMTLNDKRNVLYITYIFTAPKYRNKGIASMLLNKAEEIAKLKDLHGILLTCDTEDKKVYDLYIKRGFMLDFHLRRYTKYDVLFLNV